MQHGSGQDQSDWMNMGDVPVIMDNLLQDGLTEPAVVVTTNTNYLGSSAQGYLNLREHRDAVRREQLPRLDRRGGSRVRRSVGGRRGHLQPHQLRRDEVRLLRGVQRWRGSS